jgi:beta-galactosidase/beta-glucuronidase
VAVSSLAAFAGIPLPEHPRPDWERAEWENLNGEWDFGFAPDRLDKRILVPFGWGSPLSGVKDEGDTGYYRRDVVVPESWKGKRVFLVIGASDHDTTVAFAGKELGTYVGGYVPFEFELTDLV